jgi:hypothetical protein
MSAGLTGGLTQAIINNTGIQALDWFCWPPAPSQSLSSLPRKPLTLRELSLGIIGHFSPNIPSVSNVWRNIAIRMKSITDRIKVFDQSSFMFSGALNIFKPSKN